jgi:hypothetical protein
MTFRRKLRSAAGAAAAGKMRSPRLRQVISKAPVSRRRRRLLIPRQTRIIITSASSFRRLIQHIIKIIKPRN